jgi:hypothetical protein
MSDAGQKGTKAAIRRWCRNSWACARDYPDAIGASPPVEPISESDRTLALAAYSELSSRRAGYDTLMWQVPAFVATVQGVLLGFVLKTNQQSTQRWVMLVVAAWIALVGLQTMRKHRYFHTVDAELMANLERRMGMRNATGIVDPRIRRRSDEAGAWSRAERWTLHGDLFAWVMVPNHPGDLYR